MPLPPRSYCFQFSIFYFLEDHSLPRAGSVNLSWFAVRGPLGGSAGARLETCVVVVSGVSHFSGSGRVNIDSLLPGLCGLAGVLLLRAGRTGVWKDDPGG